MAIGCPDKRLKAYKDLVKIHNDDAILIWNEYEGNVPERFYKESVNKPEIQYQKQTASDEGIVAAEKTIRDLAARMSDRIGMKYKIISDRSQVYKGKIENNTAVVNLAYATLDTPIHEILGHPIIRAIKNRRTDEGGYIEQYNNAMEEFYENNPNATREQAIEYADKKVGATPTDLYQNLLKELEYGKGKEVLDRIKRDYDIKTSKYQKLEDENDINHIESVDTFKIGNDEYKYEYKEFEGYSGYYPSFIKNGKEIEFEEFKKAYNKNIDLLSVK